jgi:hypothetical protein
MRPAARSAIPSARGPPAARAWRHLDCGERPSLLEHSQLRGSERGARAPRRHTRVDAAQPALEFGAGGLEQAQRHGGVTRGQRDRALEPCLPDLRSGRRTPQRIARSVEVAELEPEHDQRHRAQGVDRAPAELVRRKDLVEILGGEFQPSPEDPGTTRAPTGRSLRPRARP